MKSKLSVDHIDIDARGTVDVSRRGRSLDDWLPVRVEPAWFVPREKSLARLSRRLLSEASPTSGAATKTITFRLAAILDHSSGAVHLVSVCYSNGQARVTRFIPGIGRCQSARYRTVAFQEVLSVMMADGCWRFEVIGSARTKEPTEFYLLTFRDRREFRELFAGPVLQAQLAAQSIASVIQMRMEAFGVEFGATCHALEQNEHPQEDLENEIEPEDLESGPECDEPSAPDCEPWLQAEAYSHQCTAAFGALNLSRADLWLLLERMPVFSTVDELVELLYARHPDSRLVIGDEVYEIIERIAAVDVSFFTLAEETGLEQALKTYGY